MLYQKEISREKVIISVPFQLLSIVCPTITYHTLTLSSSCYLWVSLANVENTTGTGCSVGELIHHTPIKENYKIKF